MNTDFTPYYAVIFTSILKEEDEGYHIMAEKMVSLAKEQPGFLGFDSARNDTSTELSTGLGITVSYWETLEAIKKWKEHADHLVAQQKGQEDWYHWYNVKVCKVEREYEFNN